MDSVCWKKFRIGDLFDVENTWVYGKNKQYLTRLSNKTCNSIAVISGITVNNGVNYYTEDKLNSNEIFFDCLTISTRGEYSGTVTYHDEPFVLANNILAMPMPNISREAKIFIGTCIGKLGYGGYSNYPRKETLKEDVLYLPAKKDGTPDWDYMAERIKELEAERIKELEAYLIVSGLDDYRLTEADKQVLDMKPRWKEFRLKDLFEPLKVGFIGKGKKIGSATKAPDAEHCIPLTCAKIGDNGIMYWGKPGDFITYTNALSVIADGAVSAGLVYAQPEEAGAYSHSYFIKVKDIEVSKYVNMFLSAVLTKVIYPKYSREDAPRWNKISEEVVFLPIKSDDTPDWDYMERYIRATEKLVIADAVKWKDQQIATTKQIVDKTIA